MLSTKAKKVKIDIFKNIDGDKKNLNQNVSSITEKLEIYIRTQRGKSQPVL
jgi:hypothetical protein